MYFPSNMNFQYFFFDTYPGYLLQVIPLALIVGALYWIIKLRRDKKMPLRRKICSFLLVCYMTALAELVLAIKVIGALWYRIFYHMASGIVIRPFAWDINLVPDFFRHLDGETIGNFVLFLPFGILYPLSKENATLRRTVLVGFLFSLVIEILQPFFGRAFDINDLILNTLGVFVSAGVFYLAKKLFSKKNN